MNNIAVIEYQGQVVVDSRLVASELGIEHKNLLETIRKHQAQIEQAFGLIAFETEAVKNEGARGTKHISFCYLNENQATYVMTLSRNTPQVVQCKLNLVKAFAEARETIKNVVPAQANRIRELELELELRKAEQKLLDTRNTICTTCPDYIQQRILGYTEIHTVEVRDRIIHGNELINDGSTINKTELCYRYDILTKNGKPDYKRLNAILESVGALEGSFWQSQPTIHDNLEFKREYLALLDKLLYNGDRQKYIGE